MKTKEFGERFRKRSDIIQWSFEIHSNGKIEKGFASPFEIGSTEIREDFATDCALQKKLKTLNRTQLKSTHEQEHSSTNNSK